MLTLSDLQVTFGKKAGSQTQALAGVSLSVNNGEIVGLVGESGSGKSTAALAILGLLAADSTVTGEINWSGRSLLSLRERELQQVRGREIAMIFQQAQSALNPVYTIGHQMVSLLRLHGTYTRKQARQEAIGLLERVHLSDPAQVLQSYPHQLSGGMAQRVMIAMALSCNPKLLIADEPTSALDVTVQAQIMRLLLDIQRERDMGILIISHDLGVIAGLCDRVAVMYAGQIVEVASAQALYSNPQHPYTQALLEAVPRIDPSWRLSGSGENLC